MAVRGAIQFRYNVSGIGALFNLLYSTFLESKGEESRLRTKLLDSEHARGWGDRIEWYNSMSEGLDTARREKKPAMLVVHKSSCVACNTLKSSFSQNQEIYQLSEQIVMINLYPSELPADPVYHPDGSYVPRVMFFSPSGSFLRTVMYNKDSDYKYAYDSPGAIASNMKKVISGAY